MSALGAWGWVELIKTNLCKIKKFALFGYKEFFLVLFHLTAFPLVTIQLTFESFFNTNKQMGRVIPNFMIITSPMVYLLNNAFNKLLWLLQIIFLNFVRNSMVIV